MSSTESRPRWLDLSLAHRVEIILFVLILALGAALRLTALGSVPPGVTHDEADHALDAAGVLAGNTPLYFSTGYGREPLFDYLTAPLMLIFGQRYLTSRITAALLGTILLALVYVWVRRATQNGELALATMAGLAFSFWGISSSRQALRSITLPVLFMAAAIAMRYGIRVEEDLEVDSPLERLRPSVTIDRWGRFVLAGVFLGLSIYTYLPARVMWLVFPAFFIFLSLTQPGVIRRAWPGLLVMLGVAALVAAPLIVYLVNHPGIEARLIELSAPLDHLLSGDSEQLQKDIRTGLGIITVRGDPLWLYNIPGKPLIGPLMSLLFYLGLSVAIMSLVEPYRPAQRGRRSYDEAFRISSANAFMLLTLAAGLSPALVTEPAASIPRVIGMQPALYYFPALAAVYMADWARQRVGQQGETAVWAAFGIVILVVGGMAINDYFVDWGRARDVRVAYHTTLVETLHYLDDHPELGPDVMVSTIYPGRLHDPAVARMTLRRDDLNLRWFDGRSSLVLPNQAAYTIILPEIAQPESPLPQWEIGQTGVQQVTTLSLGPDDFNRTVRIVEVYLPEGVPAPNGQPPVALSAGGIITLHNSEYQVVGGVPIPGAEIEVLTFWQVEESTDQEIVFFTHALDSSGELIAQQDLTGASAWSWQPGDLILQVHRFKLPDDTPPGPLELEVGAYTLPDMERLPFTDASSAPVGDTIPLGEFEVVSP
jgi:hypothetical protein